MVSKMSQPLIYQRVRLCANLLGFDLEQALQRSQEVLRLAQALAHPHSLAFALTFTGWLHQIRREAQATQERADAAILLSTEQGFPDWVAWAMTQRGWVLAEQGQIKEGITQMQQGLAASRATGAELLRPYFLALLVETWAKDGRAVDGLGAVKEALAGVQQNGVRQYEAELYRLKGELTLQAESQSRESRVKEGEECFWKAIEIARKQQAKSWELRAATSLARLWQQQGKHHEAHRILSEVYNWFTEGFDTKDLQEAKALLEELAGKVFVIFHSR
jgi:adenylate cyclase